MNQAQTNAVSLLAQELQLIVNEYVSKSVDADGATTWIDFNVEDSGYERKIWSTLESAHKEIQRLIKIPPRRQRPEHGMDGFTALKGELDEACAHSHLTLSGTTKFMITPVIKVVAPHLRTRLHLHQ